MSWKLNPSITLLRGGNFEGKLGPEGCILTDGLMLATKAF